MLQKPRSVSPLAQPLVLWLVPRPTSPLARHPPTTSEHRTSLGPFALGLSIFEAISSLSSLSARPSTQIPPVEALTPFQKLRIPCSPNFLSQHPTPSPLTSTSAHHPPPTFHAPPKRTAAPLCRTSPRRTPQAPLLPRFCELEESDDWPLGAVRRGRTGTEDGSDERVV